MGGDEAREQADAAVAGARVLSSPPSAAMLAIVTLGMIALGFVTPPIIPHWLWPYSTHVHVISPYEDGASSMWSIQIVAVVLAALTLVHGRRRSAPGLASRIIATLCTLAVLHLPVVMLVVLHGEAWTITLTSVIVVVAALGALVQAWHTRGWLGWLWALAAYAIAALPYACPLWPGIFNVFSGGVTFLTADVTLLALAVLGLRAADRSTALRAVHRQPDGTAR